MGRTARLHTDYKQRQLKKSKGRGHLGSAPTTIIQRTEQRTPASGSQPQPPAPTGRIKPTKLTKKTARPKPAGLSPPARQRNPPRRCCASPRHCPKELPCCTRDPNGAPSPFGGSCVPKSRLRPCSLVPQVPRSQEFAKQPSMPQAPEHFVESADFFFQLLRVQLRSGGPPMIFGASSLQWPPRTYRR
jgi:hypothetical protein